MVVVVAATTRFVSLASVLAAACVPFGALALGAPRAYVLGALAAAGVVIVRHRENIAVLTLEPVMFSEVVYL